jgi:hypothetical protein
MGNVVLIPQNRKLGYFAFLIVDESVIKNGITQDLPIHRPITRGAITVKCPVSKTDKIYVVDGIDPDFITADDNTSKDIISELNSVDLSNMVIGMAKTNSDNYIFIKSLWNQLPDILGITVHYRRNDM